MADTVTIKKITDLPENTDANDADLFMQGVNGTASLRKIKWSTILAKIKSKLLANNLTTTQEGYALDARQGKALSDQINALNTKRTWQKLAEQTSLGAWENHAVDNLSQYNEIAVIAYDTTGSFATYILATALFTGTTDQIPFGGHNPQGQGFGLSRYLNNETISLFTSPSSSKTELYGIL